ncbi:hypothetical protein QSK_1018 [Clostridioides difficile P29]|nr:hypothetical protein QSK_1018 [Clostridioides difficile P29]
MVFSLVSSCNGFPPFVFYGGMPAAGKWGGHEKKSVRFHDALLNPYPQPGKVCRPNTHKIPVVPILHTGRLPFAPHKDLHAVAAMQAPVIVVYVKANVVAVSGFIKNQSSCFLCHYKILLWVGLQAFALVAGVIGYAGFFRFPIKCAVCHIVRYKGRVIAANRRRGIEKGSFHVLLDVADFGGVFLHTVQYKADMFAVQFHKFCFYKLCRVVVPGDTDCSSFGADGFKNKGKDFLYPVPVKVSVLYQIVVLDIVLDDFLIHAICVCRFLSLPFRRLCRVL